MQKFRNNVIWTTVLTALAGVCLGLLSLYFAAAGSGAMCRFYLKDPLLAALNVLPFVLFALLLFILTPQASADVICYVAGILLLASGVAAVISYLASGRLFGSYALVSGIVLLVCGVFCLLRPEIIQGLLTVLFGVFLVIDGMMTLQDGVDCARARLAGWWVPALLGAVTIALGCVVLFGKFDSIMLLAGISLIVDGVFDLIVTFAFSKRIRTAREKLRMYANGPIIDSEKVDD